ncbi:unnamed protein product, partial [marine sediment metagenome]
MLRTKVAAGELPPVEERLPDEPLVVSSERNKVPKGDLDFEIGQYGGVLRTVRPAPDWSPDVWGVNNQPLVGAPGILAEDVGGNVVKGFEVS